MSTNKDQIHFSSKIVNLIFHIIRGKGNLFSYMLNRIKWYLYPKLNFISKFPEHVDMELSSACNMRCPMCYTITKNYIKNVKRTNMSMEKIEKVLWLEDVKCNDQYHEILKKLEDVKIKNIKSKNKKYYEAVSEIDNIYKKIRQDKIKLKIKLKIQKKGMLIRHVY